MAPTPYGSPEYTAAIKANNAAIAAYNNAVTLYRSMKIGDAEFLQAKAAYKAAVDAFDVAFDAEMNGGEVL